MIEFHCYPCAVPPYVTDPLPPCLFFNEAIHGTSQKWPDVRRILYLERGSLDPLYHKGNPILFIPTPDTLQSHSRCLVFPVQGVRMLLWNLMGVVNDRMQKAQIEKIVSFFCHVFWKDFFFTLSLPYMLSLS